MRFAGLCFAILAMGVAGTAKPTEPTQTSDPYARATSDAALSKIFVCPNPSVPLVVRRNEVRNFFDWIKGHHGDWTINQVIAFRMKLLQAHQCTQTLKSIRDNSQARSQKALANLTERASQGDAAAQTELGLLSAMGRDVPQDYARAFKWFTKAADQGFAGGQYGLGLLYDRGDGVPQNYAKAIEWYRKAAGQHFAPAETNLGHMYEYGTGVQQSYVQAMQWYTKAADQHNATAQNSLGAMYANGQGVQRDDVTAAKWFLLAKSGGSEIAACSLPRLEARMTPPQITSAGTAVQAWRAAHVPANGPNGKQSTPATCPEARKSGYGNARFATEQAGRNAAAHLLDTWYGDVSLSGVAAKGYAPDTAVNPEQAEIWTHGVEAYMRLDGYADFSLTVHHASNREFNDFLDAMTNQEGRTNMGSLSYERLRAANPSRTDITGIEPLPDAIPLPQAATIATQLIYKQFRLSPAASADMQGESVPQGTPASQISEADGMGGWIRPTPTALPQFVLDGSASKQRQIELFLLNAEWIVVPKGWRLLSAVNAVTPTWAATFVAPGGPNQGWLAIGGSGPGMSEVFSGAAGYFPGAYRLYNSIIPDALAKDIPLSPAPDSLTHPTPCTAVVAYASGNLAVRGVKLFQPLARSGLSPYVRSLFLALPKGEKALQAYLITGFQQEHPVVACGNKAW
ncbi:MAG: hypothetical protein ACREPU_03640 [Rhodanobacteraceae bacterium]